MQGGSAAIAVVVCARSGTGTIPALASARESARRASVSAQLVLVRENGSGDDDAGDADATVDAFALDSAYLRNRGLELTGAPIVAFLADDLEVDPGWVAAVAQAFALSQGLGAAVGPVGAGRRSGQFSPGENAAFDRAALVGIGGFDRDLGAVGGGRGVEVEDALLRLAARGRPRARTPAMLAARRGRELRRTRAVDPILLGRLFRRHRKVAPLLPHLAGLRPTEAARRTGSWLLGSGSKPPSAPLLGRIPEPLRTQLAGTSVVPDGASSRAKTHFRFRAGEARMLHLYVNPSERLRRALAERELIRARAHVDGIPRLYESAPATDALWVLEDAVPGSAPRPDDVRAWFPAVADWAVAFAGPPGRTLERCEHWRDHRRDALELAADAGLADVAESSFELVSRLPSRHMHGDFQRRNVLIAGGRIGLVDWEGAWAEGVPGLDLVFLALLARGDRPDAGLLPALAGGKDSESAPVLARLERLELTGRERSAALVVMLATWSLAERRRLARLGAPPGEPVWEPLFRRLAATLCVVT